MVHVIDVDNVNQALATGLQYLQEYGIREDTRNGSCLVAPGPVVTIYHKPQERVLFSPVRNANPFFHLMEALWMLNGQRDIKFPAFFNQRFNEYSDDGVVDHGAYGYRWRKWFGVDQLELLRDELVRDPKTRRAVLTMWSPNGDLVEAEDVEMKGAHIVSRRVYGGLLSKDIPCFAGDTIIWSPEGNLPISEISKKFQNKEVTRWPVYGVDETTKEVKLTWATSVWRSGRKATVRVTFDDGSSIRVTPDHILYKRGRKAVEAYPFRAGELRPGDRVLATSLWAEGKGYLRHKKFLGVNTSHKNMVKIHREYYELLTGTPLPSDVDVHHLNELKQDNRAENIEALSHSDHAALKMLGDKNPHRLMSPEKKKDRARKQAASLTETWRQKKEAAIDNHRVISVEPCPAEDVYDFTVPETHTALVGTGVVAHNCNTQAYFDVRGGKLNMTVCCRSNDIYWGAYGANAVHFSIMQEFMAAWVGVPMGEYRQFSNNYHLYEAIVSPEKASELIDDCDTTNFYEDAVNEMVPTPLISSGMRDWQTELKLFMEHPTEPHGELLDPFFNGTVYPMYKAWEERKLGLGTGEEWAGAILAPDWGSACRAWIERAEQRKAEKQS